MAPTVLDDHGNLFWGNQIYSNFEFISLIIGLAGYIGIHVMLSTFSIFWILLVLTDHTRPHAPYIFTSTNNYVNYNVCQSVIIITYGYNSNNNNVE